MGVLSSMIRNTMADSLKHFAKSNGATPSEVKVLISVPKEDELPKYHLHIKSKNVYKEVTMKEILNVKIDFLNKGEIAPPYLHKAIMNMSVDKSLIKEDCKPSELTLMVTANQNDGDIEPFVFLLRNNKMVSQVSYDYIIDGVPQTK